MSKYYATYRAVDFLWPAPLVGAWDQFYSGVRLNARREWGWLLSQSTANGGQIFSKTIDVEPAAPCGIANMRFVTPPLDAGSSSSWTLDLCLGMTKSGTGTGTLKVHVYVTVGDSNDVRATMLANEVTATTPTSTPTCRSATGLVLDDVSWSNGDRIAIEVGFDVTADTNAVYALYAGTTNGSNVAQSDAADGDTSVTARAGWFEFSGTLTEQSPPSAPANDACADATVIPSASVTYSTTQNTTQSAESERGVWYEWTADVTGRVFFSTIGSSYATRIRIWTGACGSLSIETFQTNDQWLGVGQTICALDAVSGTTYRIQIENFIVAGFNATLSGGTLALTFSRAAEPQVGDLFIGSQHLMIVRDGVIIGQNYAAYGSTPTGIAYDTSARPVLNQNDDTTNTSPSRVWVTTFSAELISLFDTAAFDSFGGEVNYIDLSFDLADPGEAVPNDSHPASLVVDQQDRLWIGFFGDAYDGTYGGVGSQDSVNIREVDPTLFSYDQFNENDILSELVVDQEEGGAPYFDINSDGTILYYTSAGRDILRYDLVGQAMMSALVTLAPEAGPRPGLRGIRIIREGAFAGQIIVTDGVNVKRIDPDDGSVLATYTPSVNVGDLDKVYATAGGEEFWVSDQLSTLIFRFDISSGDELEVVDLNLPTGQLCGFFVASTAAPGSPGSPSSSPSSPGGGGGVPSGSIGPISWIEWPEADD